jgi:hypothetical protein
MTNRKSTPIKTVTSAEDDTRNEQSDKLFFFDVNEDGTITECDFKEPKINSELFDKISIDRLTTPEDIVDEVQYYNALVEHFRWLARDEQEKLIHRIELQDYRDDQEHQRMKHLAEELEDEDEGWKTWINTEGDEGTPRFKKVIVDWLAPPSICRDDRNKRLRWRRRGIPNLRVRIDPVGSQFGQPPTLKLPARSDVCRATKEARLYLIGDTEKQPARGGFEELPDLCISKNRERGRHHVDRRAGD